MKSNVDVGEAELCFLQLSETFSRDSAESPDRSLVQCMNDTYDRFCCRTTNCGVFMAPKARPLYFTSVILLFCYFVSIDGRPVMGPQPNLASRSKVVSIYNSRKKISGASPNLGRKKHQIFDHFLSRLSHPTPHISGTKRRIDKQKC